MQRVEGLPALRVRHRPVQVTGGGAGRDQAFQHRREPLAEPVGGRGLPVVELGAVAQREPGQEVVPVQPGRAAERAGVRRGRQGLEVRHVHPDPPSVQGYRCPGDQQARAGRRRRHREGAPQGGPGPDGVGLRPQQRRQALPAQLVIVQREQRQDGGGLAGIETDRHVIPGHRGRPQQGKV